MPSQTSYDFDIDHYLNRLVPPNRLDVLPTPIARFLGYHEQHTGKSLGNVLGWLWAFLGAFCGILVVEAVYRTPLLHGQGAPIVIGSLGASAILKYNTIDSPLSQPRNAILGQLFSSLIGVSISKLFLLSSNYDHIRIVGGALAVGLSSLVMGFTKTVHPPAGATALLAVCSNEVRELGWFLVGLIVLGATLMVMVALVINNISRTYPVYWWSPAQTGHIYQKKHDDEEDKDVEKGDDNDDRIQRSGREAITIEGHKIIVPGWMTLGVEEKAVLEVLRSRLEHELVATRSRGSDATFVADHDAPRDRN